MPLVRHDTDLWSTEHEFGWLAGQVRIPVRMTVLRLDDRQLVLHSPVPISAALRDELDALGSVDFIVVPRAHGRFAAEAAKTFPRATVLDAANAPAAWSGRLESLLLAGFRLQEVVLFHPSSRTLVLTDLCFNIQHASSLRSRLFLRANGMWQRFGPSRMIRALAVSNRTALRRSLETVLRWDFDRIVPGHGAVVETGGPEALRAAWLA